MAPLIAHIVLVLVGIRLALYCAMGWRRLKTKHAIASSRPRGWERFFLLSLPLIALLIAAQLINSALAIVRMLGSSAP